MKNNINIEEFKKQVNCFIDFDKKISQYQSDWWLQEDYLFDILKVLVSNNGGSSC
jgi:tyrosyl-tRNA synthetase